MSKTKVLLIGMPDVIGLGKLLPKRHSYPNLAIISLASNLDDCDAKVLNLVFKRKGVRKTLLKYLNKFEPEVVGLSSMSFQFNTLMKIAEIVKESNKDIKIVVGGYHASLMYKEIASSSDTKNIDFIVRGEGEITFNELVKAIKSGGGFDGVLGLSYKVKVDNELGYSFVHNDVRPLADLKNIKLPDRNLDVLNLGYNAVIETSRGCTMGCKFCSISRMLGRNYREYPIERVIDDIRNIKKAGYKSVAVSDDNASLNVKRLEKLLDRIIEEGLNDLEYSVQLSSDGVAASETLCKKMKKAGFVFVFLGVENFSMTNREFLNKQQNLEKSFNAMKYVKDSGMLLAIGLIVGNPDDTEETIKRSFKMARKSRVDFIHVQFLQPYPATKLREELLDMGLVVNKDDFSKYCGHCNIKTKHISHKELKRVVGWERIKVFIGMLFDLKSGALKEYGLVYYPLVLYLIYAYLTDRYYKVDVRF